MHAMIANVKPENVNFEMMPSENVGIRELSAQEISFVGGAALFDRAFFDGLTITLATAAGGVIGASFGGVFGAVGGAALGFTLGSAFVELV